MARLQRKNLSFQAGEISPRFYGRSDTEVYSKGLAIAENVTIDKRGGAFKRGGFEHIGQVDANNARLFTLQVSRVQYYTIVVFYDLLLNKGQMLIAAPGARLLGNNLLQNGNFAASGAFWNSAVNPPSSQVIFSVGEAELRPAQENHQLLDNGNFQQEELGWTVRESTPLSEVTFEVGSVTFIPEEDAGEFAGIAQEMFSGSNGEVHTFVIDGDWGNNTLRVRIGTVEGVGEYYDEFLTNEQAGMTIDFTPATSAFWITIDSIYPDNFARLENVSVLEIIDKTAEISQMATVTDDITDNHLAIVGQSSQVQIHILIGTTDGANDIGEFQSTALETTIEFVPNNATYWVTVQADGDEIVEAKINFVGTAGEGDTNPLGLLMDTPWSEADIDELHMIEVPSGKTLYFTHPNIAVQKLIYDHVTDTFVPLETVVFTEPPPEWGGMNHPATGTHFQGRLWLGGTPSEGQTIWGSVSGSPEDFTVTEDEDSSSLEFTLQEFGRIEWMLGTKNLLIGAENGEHLLTSEGGVIIPRDFNIEQQSSYGSNKMQAIQVGEKVFYLTPDGRKLRAMGYQWQENNWLSQDLTFASEHITDGIAVRSAWAQNPDALFALIMRDGTMAMLTYDRTAETVAWSRFITPGMLLKDVATGRREGINLIVVVGQRTIGKIDLLTNSPNTVKLDSFASVFDPLGTNIITGLEHLEGQTVRPLVDGAVNPLVVVTGGQVTTQDTGQQLSAGIPYTATIITLPPDIPQDQIRSWKKRWNKVWAFVYNSKQPIINGIRPPDRTPATPMDTVEPDRFTHYKTVNLGWDDFGQVTIEEDLPVNMNVLAIYGEMRVEEVG